MVVRFFWRDWNFGRKPDKGDHQVDAFWVEATSQQAAQHIFPLLDPDTVLQSEAFVATDDYRTEIPLSTPHPYCFLVSRDLSHVRPYPLRYPYHQLWNAYSPFEHMDEVHIQGLEELTGFVLPAAEQRGA